MAVEPTTKLLAGRCGQHGNVISHYFVSFDNGSRCACGETRVEASADNQTMYLIPEHPDPEGSIEVDFSFEL